MMDQTSTTRRQGGPDEWRGSVSQKSRMQFD